MTTDPTDQIGVVHRRPLLRVESHPLGDAGRDQRRSEHVFHRLTQTEVDRQRYRRQQLGSTQAFARVAQRPGGMHAFNFARQIVGVAANAQSNAPGVSPGVDT